ncbi:MAG: GNAT family N-acetyltransferase [Lachnospiraceae bacterium]
MNIRLATIQDLDAITTLERLCFPPAEAASRESFEQRLKMFSNHFWILEENGVMISVINGMVTNEPQLQDEMFADAGMHEEEGDWQMIFGVETAPEFRGKGYASVLMKRVIEDCREQERKGIVLTCKDKLLSFYEHFGFVNEGMSDSQHGGATWYEMRLTF